MSKYQVLPRVRMLIPHPVLRRGTDHPAHGWETEAGVAMRLALKLGFSARALSLQSPAWLRVISFQNPPPCKAGRDYIALPWAGKLPPAHGPRFPHLRNQKIQLNGGVKMTRRETRAPILALSNTSRLGDLR